MASDPSRLYSQLLNTGLSQRDNPTYQVIRELIRHLTDNFTASGGASGGGGGVGPAGPPGPSGKDGNTGPIGFSGEDGDEGPLGPIGLQGIQGPTGVQGIPGIPGNDGFDGEDGLPGPQGPAGASGTDAFVPYHILAGSTFTVPVNKQALFAMNINNEGILVVDGFLIEVDGISGQTVTNFQIINNDNECCDEFPFVPGGMGSSAQPSSPFANVVTNTETGTKNDWVPAGTAGVSSLVEWSGASDITVTGFGSGSKGQYYFFKNTGSKNAFFKNLNGGSSAADQLANIITTSDTPVCPGGYILFYNNGTNWVIHSHEQGAWLSYTPAWTAQTGNNPTVGNATLLGKSYLKGTIAHWKITTVWGSTTDTTTSGVLTWSLPYTAAESQPFSEPGPSTLSEATTTHGATGQIIAQIQKKTSTTVYNLTDANPNGVSGTNEFTFGQDDAVLMNGTIEVA